MQSVSPDVETRASRAASYHPLWAQATAHAYCATDVSVEAVNLIGRMRSLTDTTREELLKALLTENSVLVVSCWTSEKQPEPLAGGGKHYVFLLHPDSFKFCMLELEPGGLSQESASVKGCEIPARQATGRG
jgi:hypothetical protein